MSKLLPPETVCGFQYKTALDSHKEESTVFPIVGLDHLGHGTKDAEITRLKKLDSEQEGLLVKLAGGEYFDEEQQKKKNAGAVIEFQCDPDRSGLEGLQTTEDTEEERRRQWQLSQRADETNGDNENNDNGTIPEGGRSLQFKSFGPADDDTYVLKLNWRTRYACDNYRDEPGEKNPDGGNGDGSSHWGFFTWLIIMYDLPLAPSFCTTIPVEPCIELTRFIWTVSSSASQHTSSSAPGSTTTATAPAGGISSRTATRSAIFPTSSRTGYGGWSIRCKGRDLEGDIVLFRGGLEID